MLTSVAIRPARLLPVRATSSSTSTPFSRSAAWSASMSLVAKAQWAASPPGRAALARRHQRDRVRGPDRCHLDPAVAGAAVVEIAPLLEAERADVELERALL